MSRRNFRQPSLAGAFVSQRKYSLERTIPFVSEPQAAIKIRELAIARVYAKRSYVLARNVDDVRYCRGEKEEKTA
jgi:hypothetical protein